MVAAMPIGRTADPARTVIGPDDPADTIGPVVARVIAVIGRREVAPMVEVPPMEVWPLIGRIAVNAISTEAVPAAAIDMRGTEPAAVKRAHPSAMDGSAAETASATEATASADMSAAMAATHFDRRAIASIFR